MRRPAHESLEEHEERERDDEQHRELLHEHHEREGAHERDAAREALRLIRELEEEPYGRRHAQRVEAVGERKPGETHQERREGEGQADEQGPGLAEPTAGEGVVHEAQEEVRRERKGLQRVEARAEESRPEGGDDDEADARRRREDPSARRRVPLLEERGERGESPGPHGLHVVQVVPVVRRGIAHRGRERAGEDPGEASEHEDEEARAEQSSGAR